MGKWTAACFGAASK